MAPRTIAIRKNANGVDPVSPIPVRRDDFPKSNIPTPNTTNKPAFRSSSNRFLANKSANTHGRELNELKNKYKETKSKMEEMKREKNENNKRLIEMSGLVKSLEGIPVNYNKTDEGNNVVNVHRKIEAIVLQMDDAKKRYDELKNEKSCQTDTIKAQELQIKAMEDQIALLNERLKREELEQQEHQKVSIENQEKNTEELEQRIMLQEMEVMNLMAEIDYLKKGSNSSTMSIGKEIKLHEANNAAKYAEIKKMEDKLASMRAEQSAQKQQKSMMKKNLDEKLEFVLQPTATTCAEINKLECDLANLREAQETNGVSENQVDTEEDVAQAPKPASNTSKRQNSQPWNRDLAWKENILDGSKEKETELAVVSNNDITFEEPTEDQNELSLPSLASKAHEVKSVRKKTRISKFGVGDRSVSSDNSPNPAASSEGIETELEEFKLCKDNDDGAKNSDTSATDVSSEASCSTSQLTSPVSSSDDDESGLGTDVPRRGGRIVELMHSDDGSVEAIGYTKTTTKETARQSIEGMSQTEPSVGYNSGASTGGLFTTEGSSSSGSSSGLSESGSSSGESATDGSSIHEDSSNEENTHGELSNANSFGAYTSGESTQSSSRSILEQIPEGEEGESDESESGWGDDNNLTDSEHETKDQQIGSLLLRKKLNISESKYAKLMVDFNTLASKSQMRMEKLEEDNKKLRDDRSQSSAQPEGDYSAMGSTSNEDRARCRRLKNENKMLLKSMEKQNEVMLKVTKNYEELEMEHSNTMTALKHSKERYDQLILDFSDIAERSKDAEDFNRLQALHDAVVMKLADVGEENDKLTKERDRFVDLLEGKNIQMRGYDEVSAALKKTEYELKMLQDVHKDTVMELLSLTDKSKELKDLYDKEVKNARYAEKLQKDFVSAKTEIELLKASNREFLGIEKKLNASEVRVAILEEKARKSKEVMLVLKKKSDDRGGQLRDVISQYKTLKQEHADKCAKLARLELAVDGLDSEEGIKEVRKMEKSIRKAKDEAEEAIKAKEAREGDMRIVLRQYEKLKNKYKKLELESKSVLFDVAGETAGLEGKKGFFLPIVVEEETKEESDVAAQDPPVEEEKKDVISTIGDESTRQEEFEELERLLEKSKESIIWKDDKIAKTLTELKQVKEQITTLETQKEELEVELSTLKSQLLLARKEADNATERQGNGQDHLRTSIAKHHRLQQVYDSLLKRFEEVRVELEQTKKLAKVKDQEEKHARKRASSVHSQFKKLQADHDVVVLRLEKLKMQIRLTGHEPKEEPTEY